MLRTAMIFTLVMLVQLVNAQNVSEEHKALVSEATEFFNNEEFVLAHPLYSQLVSLYPSNPEFNYKFGASAIFNGEDRNLAIKHLNFGAKKGQDVAAYYYLGRAHHLNYDFKEAIKAYEKFEQKADSKTKANFDAARQIEMCEFGGGLLTSIKDLVVLDKKETNENDFFRYYNLDDIGGKILTVPEDLKTKVDKKNEHIGTIHFPGESTVIYFSSYGKDDKNGTDLYRANILPDGKFGNVEKLKGYVNTQYDEDFAYMHPDGKTLFFASKGHNSMGGFDIFKSIYDENTDSYGPPENLDFAINTPDDDIFYVVDSLKNTAWFASGRSSSLGNLHVYKVMVKGIPLQLTFLQGDFVSEIDSEQKIAKIVVRDELTDRPISEVHTDPITGDYLLSISKPGLYKFVVEAENSPMVHEGIVEIPVFDESVAVRQELRLVKENGMEKLIITNFFDEFLNLDLAQLSKEVLQNKAGLEVNVNDELLAELNAPEETLTIEKSLENAPIAAGFSEGTTIDNVKDDAQNSVDEINEFLAEIDDKINLALLYAEKKQKLSDEKLNEADRLMHSANKENEEDYVEKMVEANKLMKQANYLREEAQVALEIANKTGDYSSSENQRSTNIKNNVSQMEQSASSDNFEELVAAIRWEKDRQMSDVDKADSPKEVTLKEASEKADAEQVILNKISELRTDEKGLETALKINNNLYAEAKKKSEKSKLEEEKAELTNQLALTKQEITEKTQRVENIGKDEELLNRQADFYTQLMADASNLGFSAEEIRDFTSTDKELLAANIASGEIRLSAMEITDEETLALIGNETKSTRNDIVSIKSIQAKVVRTEFDLKPVRDIASTYEQSLIALEADANQSTPSKKRILLKQTLGELDSQIIFLENARAELTEVEEITRVDNELQAMNSLKSTLMVNDVSVNLASKTYTLNELRQSYSEVMPDYKTQSLQIAEDTDDEISRSLRTQELKRNTQAKFVDAIANNENQIMLSDDEATIVELTEANNRYEQAVVQISEELNDINYYKAAFETENKTIIESNEVIVNKLQEQIRLTQDYLSMLDQVSVATEREKNNENDADKIAQLVKMLEELQSERFETDVKLQNYKDDLALTMATSEEPAMASTYDNKPMELPESNGEIVRLINPDYSQNWSKVDITYPNVEDRKTAKVELNNELIENIDSEIELRTAWIDKTENEEEKDLLQLEIGQLESLKTNKIAENANLAPEISTEALADLETENNTELTSSDENKSVDIDPFEMTEEKEDYFREVFEEEVYLDPKDVYESDLLFELVETNDNPKIAIDNEEKLFELENDIANLESQLKNEDNKSKKKSIDRKLEKKHQDLADEEIDNARKIAQLTRKRFDENQRTIEEYASANMGKLSSKQILEDEIDKLLRKANSDMEEAQSMRDLAGPEIDEIKQNYMYREAFMFEQTALNNQDKAIAMYENIDFLVAQEDEELMALKMPKSIEEEELTAETLADNETDITAENNIDVAEEITSENESDLTEANIADNTEIDNSNSDIIEEEKPELEEMANHSIALAEVVNRRQIQSELVSTYSLEADVIDKVLAQPEYRAYLETANTIADKESARSILITERNELVRSSSDIMQRIAMLEQSIENTDDESEKEGMRSEIARLIASAEVNYERVTAIDEDILGLESEINGLVADADILYAAIDTETLVKETEADIATENALALAENTSDELETPNGNEEEVIGNTDLEEEEIAEANLPIANESEALRPEIAMPSTAADFRNFAFPDFLESDIFVMLDEAAYSNDNPIPIDVSMPSGLVYKVQVGAFRNAIPASHFDKFAPMSGESLNNGITRYTAGLFKVFNRADGAKSEIRTMGYSDAFVVAFYNGVRIPLYEARQIAGESDEFIASVPNNNSRDSQTSTQGNNEENLASSDSGDEKTTSEDSYANNTSNENSSIDSNSSSSGNESSDSNSASAFEERIARGDNSYARAANSAPSQPVEEIDGMFYTVQVGVYSQPISLGELYNIQPLNTELTYNNKIRYTTGTFSNLEAAIQRKTIVVGNGVEDAFVTAYSNGKRITVSEASQVENSGSENVENDTPEIETVHKEYDLFIGAYTDDIPSDIAKAMLFLEQECGIMQIYENGKTYYYTSKVGSMNLINDYQAKFEAYEVITTTVRSFENGVLVE